MDRKCARALPGADARVNVRLHVLRRPFPKSPSHAQGGGVLFPTDKGFPFSELPTNDEQVGLEKERSRGPRDRKCENGETKRRLSP